jgi:HSP90 family molecular chaperone
MKEGQSDIFYINGTSIEALRSSPQPRWQRPRASRCCSSTTPVDEFWLPSRRVPGQEAPLADQERRRPLGDRGCGHAPRRRKRPGRLRQADRRLKLALGEQVKDVRPPSA